MPKQWFASRIKNRGEISLNVNALTDFLNRHRISPGEVLIVTSVQHKIVPITPFENTIDVIYYAETPLE